MPDVNDVVAAVTAQRPDGGVSLGTHAFGDLALEVLEPGAKQFDAVVIE